MLRSNSSHGGFTGSASRSSPSPRTNPSQVRRFQNNYNEPDHPARGAAGYALNDLEFPPPPADLPPPPESPRRLHDLATPPPRPSPSPRTRRRVGPDFSNLENIPDRISRPGRRNRDASSDSCESGLSDGVVRYQPRKSPVSPLSENRTLGSPAVASLSSPGSGLEPNTNSLISDQVSCLIRKALKEPTKWSCCKAKTLYNTLKGHVGRRRFFWSFLRFSTTSKNILSLLLISFKG